MKKHCSFRRLAISAVLGLMPLTTAAQSAGAVPDLMNRSLQMAGGVDRQLRSESGKTMPAPVALTTDKRFVADLEAATVPKWTGVARVTETAMPGTGQRLYKFSNGNATYCVPIVSPSVGIDQYEHDRKNFHIMTCPR